MIEGTFIAIEGGEGAGKSTLVSALAEALRAEGRTVVETREPGGTELGEKLREMLLGNDGFDRRAEALLFAADRAQHVLRVIMPALLRGETVITDRYLDSSIAYQGYGHALGMEWIRELHRLATGGLVPMLTILLDIDPAFGLERSGRTDRFERRSLDWHRGVQSAFRMEATRFPALHAVLDATRPADEVLSAALAAIRERAL